MSICLLPITVPPLSLHWIGNWSINWWHTVVFIIISQIHGKLLFLRPSTNSIIYTRHELVSHFERYLISHIYRYSAISAWFAEFTHILFMSSVDWLDSQAKQSRFIEKSEQIKQMNISIVLYIGPRIWWVFFFSCTLHILTILSRSKSENLALIIY